MRPGPHCKECGAGERAQFNMLPKLKNYKFGEICVPCEERLLKKVDL